MDRKLNLANEKELTALGKALSSETRIGSFICWERNLCASMRLQKCWGFLLLLQP